MDDNNQNGGENQLPVNQEVPQPVFETVPIGNSEPSASPSDLNPEEIAPDVAATEDVMAGGATPEVAASGEPMVYEENKVKYIVMALGALFFIIITIFIFSLLLKKGKETAQPKEVTLSYWGLWEEKEMMDPVIKLYEQKNPGVKIIYEKKTPQDYREKLIVRSQKGQGPDIFRFHNTWLPQIKEITAPLPPEVMTGSEFELTFYPIHQKDLKIGKYYYGLPLSVDGLVLVYNEDLFKKAGINKSPTNWDELIEDANRIQVPGKEGEIITAGIAIGTASNIEHFSDIFGLLLVLNGGDIMKLDEPEAVGALEAYRRFAEAPNNTWSEALPNAVSAFIQQKVAMIIVPSWEILTIKGTDPDLKLKVVPIPKPPGGKQASLATYWVEGVSKMSKNQLEAWKFLKFLTEKETMTKMYETQSATRLFSEPYSRVDLANLIIQNEYTGAVIKQAQDDVYISLPLMSRTYDNGLNDEIVRYIENAINATIKGVSYSEALQTAKKGVDQVIGRYKIE
ncbi:sugar ABC transporter substrate-binding protein [Candidatus Roizmanbacteria bacterium]|nr:sugar ABC transporter substrate-binding protein [Candidatus Roizmanbacteria bacterium]